jgi:hypothetical protein
MESMWKEVVLAWCEALYQHLSRTEDNHDKSQDNSVLEHTAVYIFVVNSIYCRLTPVSDIKNNTILHTNVIHKNLHASAICTHRQVYNIV